MPGVFWMDGVRVADYAANIRAGKTTVVVKLAVTDNHELSRLLDQLEELKVGRRKTSQLMISGAQD